MGSCHFAHDLCFSFEVEMSNLGNISLTSTIFILLSTVVTHFGLFLGVHSMCCSTEDSSCHNFQWKELFSQRIVSYGIFVYLISEVKIFESSDAKIC